MPIISPIGRRNWKVRLVIGTIYALLGIGAVSMIYPMLLMLSGSVKSDTDYLWITPLPGYLWDDDTLWMKYVEAKYATVAEAERAQHKPIGSWRKTGVPAQPATNDPMVDLFREFRANADWPFYWFNVGELQSLQVLGANAREYRELAKAQYGDIAAYSDALGVRYTSWSQVGAPPTPYAATRFSFPKTPNYQLLEEVKRTAPLHDRIVINLDGIFWQEFLRPQWATIQAYNAEHGTSFSDYRQVLLDARPPSEPRARRDWEQFVRGDLNIAFIIISPSVTGQFREFIKGRYDSDLSQVNAAWHTSYKSFDEIPIPRGVPSSKAQHVDFTQFVRDPGACPLEALSVYGPRQAFEEYVAQQRQNAAVVPAPLPLEAVDYADFQQIKGATRWELFTRNYIQVLDYLLLNSNGLKNTVIYCALAILVHLTINPLAAYALSRYRPPSTYKVLLFCMCTMAFPGEVTMIPNFLLLKRFPIVGIAVALVVGVLASKLLARLLPRFPDWSKGILAGVLGLAAGFYVVPQLLGDRASSVSLLNTFWALVLPGAANGFGIFLLKGFFDSLPQELYEAAEIDGAGEFTKFWTIAMSLSKPILAVMALGAFTHAYSEFMMALVIIPDPEMWTIMVWLFQLQSQVHPTVVYASLVVAAIPTFTVFMVCQNLIMRGIVVPVEK